MTLDPFAQDILRTIIAEGIKGGINILRDMRKERKEQEDLEKEAKKDVEKHYVLEAEKGEYIIEGKPAQLKKEAKPIPEKSEIEWNNVGSLFWLGNDLMWIKDMMYRGAMPERVLEGIEKAMKYATQLGFSDKSFPIDRLTLSKTIIESLVGITELDEEKFGILQQHYRTVEQYIESVKWYIDARVKEKQPGFEKL